MKNFITFILISLLITSCSVGMIGDYKKAETLQYQDLQIEPAKTISDKLDEISGLQHDGKFFYGFNDSGGKPEIYTFTSKNPQNFNTIEFQNAKNIDWEDIAISDSLIFIGDFGNNRGNRKDQTIYIVERKKLNLENKNQKIDSKPIEFFYPEQNIFEKQAYNHDFDMESMVYFNNEIHLFTKEWKSEKTHHYTLDLVKGKQPAWLVEDFDIGFLVTGADVIQLNKTKSRLAIVGYNREGEVFLMLTDFKNNSKKWLNQPKTIIKIGEANELGQVEGFAFKNPNEFCISAEAINSELGNKKQNIRCIRIN